MVIWLWLRWNKRRDCEGDDDVRVWNEQRGSVVKVNYLGWNLEQGSWEWKRTNWVEIWNSDSNFVTLKIEVKTYLTLPLTFWEFLCGRTYNDHRIAALPVNKKRKIFLAHVELLCNFTTHPEHIQTNREWIAHTLYQMHVYHHVTVSDLDDVHPRKRQTNPHPYTVHTWPHILAHMLYSPVT